MLCVKLFPNGVKTINFAFSSLFKTCLQQKNERRQNQQITKSSPNPSFVAGLVFLHPRQPFIVRHQPSAHGALCPSSAMHQKGHHGKKNSYAWILNIGKGTEVFSRLEICQKIYTTENFRVKNLHRKRVIFDIC